MVQLQILQITAMKSLKRRGQAFIVFATVESAMKAVADMQGFPLQDKPMKIAFAKSKSDAISKQDGTFAPRVKPPKPPRKRRAAPGMCDCVSGGKRWGECMTMMNGW